MVMKKYLMFLLILSFNIIVNGQELVIPSGASFHVSQGVALILSEGTGLNVNSQNVSFDGNIKFTGNEEQTVSGSIPVNINNLSVNNNGLILENNLTINSELTMQNGIINIQNNNLTIENSADIVGNFSENCMIVKDANGVFQRNVSNNGTYIFPIGDISGSADYSPAEIDMLSGTYSDANIAVDVTNSKFSQNNSTANYLNRYWDILASGISNPQYDINLNYVSADIIGDETEIYGAYYTDEWHLLNPVSSGTISATNMTEFGTFTGGEQTALVGINNLSDNKIDIKGTENGIFVNSNLNIKEISVFNILGQKIYQQKKLSSNFINFNTNTETAVYFVRVLTDKGYFVKKVLIY